MKFRSRNLYNFTQNFHESLTNSFHLMLRARRSTFIMLTQVMMRDRERKAAARPRVTSAHCVKKTTRQQKVISVWKNAWTTTVHRFLLFWNWTSARISQHLSNCNVQFLYWLLPLILKVLVNSFQMFVQQISVQISAKFWQMFSNKP